MAFYENPVFTQITFGILALSIGILIIAVLMRGYFLRWLRVRLSSRRLVLVNIKKIPRDEYAVASIEDGWIVYKTQVHIGKKKEVTKRSQLVDDSFIYEKLNCMNVDIDGATGEIIKPSDYTTTAIQDPVKVDSFLVRIITAPNLQKDYQIYIIIGVALCLVGVLACVYLSFTNREALHALILSVEQLKNMTSAVQPSSIIQV